MKYFIDKKREVHLILVKNNRCEDSMTKITANKFSFLIMHPSK